jgi:serine/threonine protein kinase
MTPVAERFDPYDQWLAIPPQEQPPDHYRLLGFTRFEGDATQFAAAADERMARLRSLQLGPRSEVSQRILNELAQARAVLIDPRRRAAYDAVLRASGEAITQDSAAWPPGHFPHLASKTEWKPGEMVGDYRILEKASSTTLGMTYKVQHAPTRRLFFLKTLTAKGAKKDEVRKRFQREIDILTRLNHPNLIVGCDQGEHAGLPYLVLEYVLGADLSRLVREQGPLPVDQAVDYTMQAARGLADLHWHGVFHRNLKPHALLVDLRGNVRITNLLLAKIGEGSLLDGGDLALTTQGETMGSIDYLPPEQAIDSSRADERSDIYSLGCTFFYLVTGQPPYPLKSDVEKVLAHRDWPPPSIRKVRPNVPRWLDEICQTMLAKKPSHRFQKANDIIAALTSRTPRQKWWRRLVARIPWIRQ